MIEAQAMNADGRDDGAEQRPHHFGKKVDAVDSLLCFGREQSTHIAGTAGDALEIGLRFLQRGPINQRVIQAEAETKQARQHEQKEKNQWAQAHESEGWGTSVFGIRVSGAPPDGNSTIAGGAVGESAPVGSREERWSNRRLLWRSTPFQRSAAGRLLVLP